MDHDYIDDSYKPDYRSRRSNSKSLPNMTRISVTYPKKLEKLKIMWAKKLSYTTGMPDIILFCLVHRYV